MTDCRAGCKGRGAQMAGPFPIRHSTLRHSPDRPTSRGADA